MTEKLSKKEAVELIKKYAKPPPKPPGGYVPSGPAARPQTGGGGGAGAGGAKPGLRTLPGHGGRPATPAQRGGGGGYYGAKPVIDMQAALQNLAKTISSTIDYNKLIQTMSTPPGQPSPEDAKDFQAQYGKDMFSNFMVGQYLRRANVHGVEYDTDPKRTKMLDKKPSDLKSMFVILDSMQRIGSEAKESFADGNWGPRTNNALRNAAAIATAVMQLGSELGMQTTAFDPSKITELNSLIPAKDTDISAAEKIQRAPKIAEILNGTNALFKDFKQQVFMDPTYRNFIEGKASMMTFGPAKDKGVDASEGEKKILNDLQQRGWQSAYASHPSAKMYVSIDKKLIPQQFQNIDVKPFEINGGDLVSTQAFDNWVNRNNVLMTIKQQNPDSWPAVIQSVLNQVVEQVKFKLAGGDQRK
jgi:hypothetical protein